MFNVACFKFVPTLWCKINIYIAKIKWGSCREHNENDIRLY